MNFKSYKIFAAFFVLALGFTVTPVVNAGIFGHKPPMPGMEGMPFGLKLFLELKLSDSQQAKMTKIINKYQDKRKLLKNNMMEARKNVMSAMQTEPFDEAATREVFRNASTLQEDLFILRAKMLAEMKTILTSEQREQRIERIKQHFEAWLENERE